MMDLAKVDSFRFLQWAAKDESDYDELFYNLGLCKVGIIKNTQNVFEELGDFHAMVAAFTNHLKTVYELEMFYGDQITLTFLLQQKDKIL